MRVWTIAFSTLAAIASLEMIPQAIAFANPNTVIDATPIYGIPSRNPSQSGPITDDLVVNTTTVRIEGATEALESVIRQVIQTRAGGTTSESQVQRDIAAILNTGLFGDATANTQVNPNGLDVVYRVNPLQVRSLSLSGATVLTPEVAQQIFASQLGQPINPSLLNQGFDQINQWYQDNGYVLAQVLVIEPQPNGVLNIEVAEGNIGNIEVRFLDEEGNLIEGRTQRSFIKDKVQLQPGNVFNLDVARQDVQQLYQLGLFQKVDIALNGDATNLNVIYDVTEAPARAVNAGGGYNGATGIFGTISYNDGNVGGVSNKLNLNVQLSFKDVQFDGNYGSPYSVNNPEMPGYNISAFRRRNLSQTFDSDVTLANGDQPREGQFGAGVTFSKPIENWDASVGLNYTRTSIRDAEGNLTPVDELGNPLSYSETGIDDLVTVKAGFRQDNRNNPINPSSGSVLNVSSEQSVPIGQGSILMNRLEADYSLYTPISLLNQESSEVLAFNLQGGTTLGDLPPYEAFNLGGINSVRGFENGEVGSGRSYVLASAEYRFPIFSTPIGGVLFADFATDLGSGDTVPGEPGEVRGKPGSGFGYGAGVRVNSPIGIIRADFGLNNQGDSKVHFGIGHRF